MIVLDEFKTAYCSYLKSSKIPGQMEKRQIRDFT